MKRSDVLRGLLACLVVFLLHGCGDDDDGSNASSAGFACEEPPEGQAAALPPGVFGGTIEGRKDPSFILWSPANDELHGQALLIYGPDLASTSRISSAMMLSQKGGIGWCSGDGKPAYNAGEVDETRDAYANLAIDPATSALSGTLRYLDSGVSYRVSGAGLPGSTYDMKAAPQFANVAGDWLLNFGGGAMTLSVDAGGAVRGSAGACAFTGKLTTGGEGMNLFAMELNFTAASDCIDRPFFRWALAMPLVGGGTQLLLWSDLQSGPFGGYLWLAIGRR